MSTSPTPLQQAPLIAGRYAVRARLGAGGSGTVYLVWDRVDGRLAALKILRVERLLLDARQSLQQEFRALALLSHPRLASAYEFGYLDDGRVPFYTREYIAGAPLRRGPPRDAPPEIFLRPIADLLEGLGHLHAHGLLHLDIHAGNLLVADDHERGSVLVDIGAMPHGLVLAAGGSTTPCAALPPELVAGSRPGPETDLYLAGRLLRERLTGRREGDAALPAEIPGWGVTLTLELERILAKAFDPSRTARFQSAAQFRAALARALGDSIEVSRSRPSARALHGRDEELARVDAVLEALNAGASSCLWICGPTGVGKSRLLAEARVRAQLRGISTVEAGAAAGPARAWCSRWARVVDGGSRRRGTSAALLAAGAGTPKERASAAAQSYFLRPRPPLALLVDDRDAIDDPLLGEFIDALAERALRRPAGASALAIFVAARRPPPRARRGVEVIGVEPLAAATAGGLLRELLGGLEVPHSVLDRALHAARGIPLYLRQIAEAFKDGWGEAGAVPPGAELPPVAIAGAGAGIAGWSRLGVRERRVLEALAAARRALRAGELSLALRERPRYVTATLRRWVRYEIVVEERGAPGGRRFRIAVASLARRLEKRLGERRIAALHARLADALAARRRRDPFDDRDFALSCLLARRRHAGRLVSRRVAARLVADGAPELALELLELALRRERDRGERLEFAEAISELATLCGEHSRAAAALAPALDGAGSALAAARRVRLLRPHGGHAARLARPRGAAPAGARARPQRIPRGAGARRRDAWRRRSRRHPPEPRRRRPSGGTAGGGAAGFPRGGAGPRGRRRGPQRRQDRDQPRHHRRQARRSARGLRPAAAR